MLGNAVLCSACAAVGALAVFNLIDPAACSLMTLVCSAVLLVLSLLLVRDTLTPLRKSYKPTDFAHAKSRAFGAQIPPPYPNGWYLVLYSFELPHAGQVRSVRALGRELAVWRSRTSGKVTVMGAYCPHLGANLAVDGTVEGDCLKCPFHGWKFAACDGATKTKVNQADVYLCEEVNGMILIWLDAKRDRGRRYPGNSDTTTNAPEQPAWRVEPGLYNPASHGQFVGLVEHELMAHISEIPENGADGNHLLTVHAPFVVSWLSGWLDHDWKFTWTPSSSSTEKHTAVVSMNLGLRVKHWGLVSALAVRVHVVQTGPALVFETLTLPLGMGTVYFCSSVTPISPKRLRYTHCMHSSVWLPRIVSKMLLRGLQSQVNRDVPIWNNKTYRAKPPLTKEDGDAISCFRQWFSQFYCAESETFLEALEYDRNHVVEVDGGGSGGGGCGSSW